MAAVTPPIWPIPAELLTWFGDVNISCDPQDGTMITAVNANAVVHGYSQWYSSHEQASKRIVELEKEIKGVDVDRSVISSLKTKMKQLKREIKVVRTAEDSRMQTSWKQNLSSLRKRHGFGRNGTTSYSMLLSHSVILSALLGMGGTDRPTTPMFTRSNRTSQQDSTDRRMWKW